MLEIVKTSLVTGEQLKFSLHRVESWLQKLSFLSFLLWDFLPVPLLRPQIGPRT